MFKYMTLHDRNPKKVKVLLKPKQKAKPKAKAKPKVKQDDIEKDNMLYRESKYVKELVPGDFYVKNLNDNNKMHTITIYPKTSSL